MNRRQKAVLYRRTYVKKSGKKSTWYYYYVYDEAGKRQGYSLGTQSKTHARKLLDELVGSGELLSRSGDALLLSEHATPYFQADRCPYVRAKRLRGERITAKTVSQNRGYIDNHILPSLGAMPLGALTPSKIDPFLLDLKETKRLSNKTINNVLSCLRVLTSEAVREGHIRSDPAKAVRPLHAGSQTRGILYPDEVKELFSDPSIWRNLAVFGINLAAATTGSRLGELRGLKAKSIRGDHIAIEGVMRAGDGYVEDDTKTGAQGLRIIPIPKITQAVLSRISRMDEPDSFIFSLGDGEKPIGANVATRALRNALARCGVSVEEQTHRNISFHSWRHFFSSLMRGRVTDTDLRQVVGHVSPSMTDHYSHTMPDHIRRVAEAQGDAFAMLTSEEHSRYFVLPATF